MTFACEALYYPFSRCMDAATLKQYLLLFDSLTFLDPVDDDGWRAHLYKDLENRHRGYLAYRDLADAIPWLRQQGVIKILPPSSIKTIDSDLTVAATLSDMADASWVSAADPRRFNIASTSFNGMPSWHIFRPKIPRDVEAALIESPDFRSHLLMSGGENSSWQLSYAAGSSISINVHLSAAEELGLAPITDSALHHELMLRKLARSQSSTASISQFSALSNTITQRTVFNVISHILPSEKLAQLSLQDVLDFRSITKTLRQEFVTDVYRIASAETEIGKVGETERAVARITNSLIESARVYGAEMTASRDKLWPKLIDGIIAPTPVSTSLAALAASYITSSEYVLAASIVLPALSPIKTFLEWRAERNKASTARSAVAYLSKVQQFARG